MKIADKAAILADDIAWVWGINELRLYHANPFFALLGQTELVLSHTQNIIFKEYKCEIRFCKNLFLKNTFLFGLLLKLHYQNTLLFV